MTERVVDRIYAHDEEGNVFVIEDHEEMAVSRPLSGFKKLSTGRRWFALEGGGHVNQVDVETFQVFETDKILKRVR